VAVTVGRMASIHAFARARVIGRAASRPPNRLWAKAHRSRAGMVPWGFACVLGGWGLGQQQRWNAEDSPLGDCHPTLWGRLCVQNLGGYSALVWQTVAQIYPRRIYVADPAAQPVRMAVHGTLLGVIFVSWSGWPG